MPKISKTTPFNYIKPLMEVRYVIILLLDMI